MRYHVGKALQLAGLLGVALALITGLLDADAEHAMIRELGGAIFGLGIFWLGRIIEVR